VGVTTIYSNCVLTISDCAVPSQQMSRIITLLQLLATWMTFEPVLDLMQDALRPSPQIVKLLLFASPNNPAELGLQRYTPGGKYKVKFDVGHAANAAAIAALSSVDPFPVAP